MIIAKADRLQHVQEYYFARKLAEVRALNAQGKDIINLGIGSPDLAPSEHTVTALNNAAAHTSSHGYQPYNGTLELRDAMATWYNKVYCTSIAQQNILPLMGSKEGIAHIAMAFLNPGDKVLVPDPGYPAYAAAAKLAGAVPVPYTLSEETSWLPQQDELQELVKQGGVKFLWINYPHMPTGAEATAQTLQWLVNFAKQNQILLVNDNPYSLILPNQKPLSLLAVDDALECCLELNSLSKSHNMAGWRVGMVAGREDYLAAVLAVKSNLDSGMFLPTQQASMAALQNADDWHAKQNKVYAARRQLVYQLLDQLNCQYEQNKAGMFVWARVPENIADVEVYLDTLLYEKGIFLTPGKLFGRQGERYLRVSLCLPAERLQEAIQRVKSKATEEILEQV